MNAKEEYYALCLVNAGRSKDVTIADRMSLVSQRMAEQTDVDDTAICLTDKGKDKMKRKGK